MATIPLSQAKTHLSEIAHEVHRTHDRVGVTRNGREFVVIISAEDLESMEATIELLSDPAAQARIAASEAEIERGETVGEAEMRAALAEQRARARARAR